MTKKRKRLGVDKKAIQSTSFGKHSLVLIYKQMKRQVIIIINMSFFSRDKRTPYEKAREQVRIYLFSFNRNEYFISRHEPLVHKFDKKNDN